MLFVIAKTKHHTDAIANILRKEFKTAVAVKGGWMWEPKGPAWSKCVAYLRYGYFYQDAPGKPLKLKKTLDKAADGEAATPAQLGEFYELALCGHESK